MWVRTEPGELVNLDHCHHIHIVECGAPKFHIEVMAMIGNERHILAYINRAGAEGKQLALDYINTLCQQLQKSGHLYQTPMYPRHTEPSVTSRPTGPIR
jgi:hypothetical protein